MVVLGIGISFAHGPFDSETSNPLKFYFYQRDEMPTLYDSYKTENIKLWGRLTSTAISPEAISEGVYDYSLAELKQAFSEPVATNEFIQWINRHNATYLRDFLLLAKELEEIRQNRVSAWYFPSDKSGFDKAKSEKERFDSILSVCGKHTSGRLADRYGLQAVRVLMTLGKFQDCVDYYNRNLRRYPDSNLFKRQAKGYIAGAMSRLGNTEEADRMFAEIGDLISINGDKPFEILVRHNPESDVLKFHITDYISLGEDNSGLNYASLADAALSSSRVVNRGDWLYLKAYNEAVYKKNNHKALALVRQALNSSFSRHKMRNDARFFEICLRAEQGDISGWQENSQWIINDYGNADGLWFYMIPALLKKGFKTEALMLANYNTAGHKDVYANIGFQTLLSMRASDVVKYKQALMNSKSRFVKKIKTGINSDENYLNEIIGTLYLREGNYSQAEKYLSCVSEDYQRSMNIFFFLTYDPWTYYYTPEGRCDHFAYNCNVDDEYWYDVRPDIQKSKVKQMWDPINAKYNFAKQMVELEHTMTHGKTSDERGLARLKYAIGRYNSLNTCWALTQYWVGNSNQCNYQPFYWLWDGSTKSVDYLIDTPPQLLGSGEWIEQQIQKAMKEIKSDESLAKAHLMLRNYRTIAKHYPSTAAGKYLSSHCDSWADWLDGR